MEKTNMSKIPKPIKQLSQFSNAQKGIGLLFTLSKECQNHDELQTLLDTLSIYFTKSQKDQAPNKHIVLFQNFLKNEMPKKRKVETIKRKKVSRNTRKKNSHLDYISEYQILRNRGYSYQGIAEYSDTQFGVKISRETIRKILIPIEESEVQK